MLTFCSNCTEIIKNDSLSFNGYVHADTDLSQCLSMTSATATFGVRILENESRTIHALGASTIDEALVALDRYRRYMYDDTIEALGIESFAIRQDFVQEAPNEDSETVRLVLVPDAIDLDGYTPMVSFEP
ncbi:hypothetical protein ACNPON_17580 [Glutamicibacter sp. AGC13]